MEDIFFFFFKQKTAYEITRCLEFRRVLFRSRGGGERRDGSGRDGGGGNQDRVSALPALADRTCDPVRALAAFVAEGTRAAPAARTSSRGGPCASSDGPCGHYARSGFQRV